MKKFVKPQLHITSIVMDENIASSFGTTGKCPFNNKYSADLQQCQKCKLYHSVKGSLPYGINIEDGGMATFCEDNNLGYTDGDAAKSASYSISCPVGLG